MASRVEGLDAFRARVLGRLPRKAKEQLKKANEKNADDFLAAVRPAVPVGDETAGHVHLVDTLEKRDAPDSETGVEVTIGGANAPHPLHLEAGHRAADGTHVPGKPFWNPARAVTRKRAKNRAGRVLSAIVKDVAANGSD